MTPGKLTTEFRAEVVASFGRRVRVRDEHGLERDARPIGRRLGVLCGDQVLCRDDPTHGETHVVQVEPRTTVLRRANVRGGSEPIVANVTLLLVVIAPKPAADLFIADRYLCAATSACIAGAVILNKADLPETAELRTALTVYAAAGYRTLECSAHDGAGVEALAELLREHRSVLVGQSGVGKSSLVNRLCPSRDATTGTLARDDEGRHTTTWSETFQLPAGGQIVDSPGVRDFAPADDALDERSLGFPEIAHRLAACRFNDCRHMVEPGCAVIAAVEAGSIDSRRYESYRRLRRLVEQLRARRD